MVSMTLNLDSKHFSVLEKLSAEQNMTKTALLRQALRLYQTVHERAKKGEQLAFTKDGKVIPLIALGLMTLEKGDE